MNGDVPLDGLEKMLFGGALGRFGVYASEEADGRKEGAVGLKGDLERDIVAWLLYTVLDFSTIA